jgi:hypothetical protein
VEFLKGKVSVKEVRSTQISEVMAVIKRRWNVRLDDDVLYCSTAKLYIYTTASIDSEVVSVDLGTCLS